MAVIKADFQTIIVFMEESYEESSEKPDPQSYNLKDKKVIVRPFYEYSQTGY